jgi:hypothetical protein
MADDHVLRRIAGPESCQVFAEDDVQHPVQAVLHPPSARARSSWALDSSTMLNDTAGLRIGTSVTEGTANFLVNRRMNKA